MRTMRSILVSLAGGVAGAMAARVVTRYQREKRAAVARLLEGSRLIETARGTVEYAETGHGPVILASHGSLGGYDQGLILAQMFPDYRVLSVSRPGYLRTPIAVGATPEAQADAFAAFLDALQVERVAITGISAGAPPALAFALRHPERCWALLLIAPGVLPPPPFPPMAYVFGKAILNSDFLTWLMTTYATDMILVQTGGADIATLKQDPQTLATLREMVRAPLLSRRAIGQLNDMEQATHLPVSHLENVRVPTLIVQGTQDVLAPMEGGRYLAECIPHAQLLVVEGGGHFALATHRQQVEPRVQAFAREHVPQEL